MVSKSHSSHNSIHSSLVVRKPFVQVVREWTEKIEQKYNSSSSSSSGKQQQIQQQQHSSASLPSVLSSLEDEKTFQELVAILETQQQQQQQKQPYHLARQQQSSNVVMVQNQLLFACRNGSDAVSLQLIHYILDKYNTNCRKSHSRSGSGSDGDSNGENHQKMDNNMVLSKVRDKDSNNCSLLHICAQRNKVQCMEFLLAHASVQIDVLDNLMSSALHYAVSQNCLEATAFLLSKGAYINAKDSYNRFPLLMALKNKCYPMLELLASFRSGNAGGGMLDVHLRGTKGNTALHFMAVDGDLDGVRFLVEQMGASPLRKNYDEENVLFCSMNHLHIVQYLASHFSNDNGVLLAKMLVNMNTSNRNLFHKCAMDGHIDHLLIVLKYMRVGVDESVSCSILDLLNTIDNYGDTPLQLAVKNSKKEMVRFLCECQEVELNEANAQEITALQQAINMSDKTMITTLSNAGASLRPVNRNDEERNSSSSCYVDFFKSMRTALMVLLSVISIVCILSMAAISLGFYGSNIAKLSRSEQENAFHDIYTFIQSRMQIHSTFIVSAASHLSTLGTNTTDSRRILKVCLNDMKRMANESDFSSSVFMLRTDGAITGALLMHDGEDVLLFDSFGNPDLIYNYEVADIHSANVDNILDNSVPITVPATDADKFGVEYQVVNQTQRAGWTLTHVSPAFPGYLYMSLMTPVIDDISNEIYAAFGGDITTEKVSHYLTQKAKDRKSTIVIIERVTGYLVATSDPSVSLYRQNGTDVEGRLGEFSHNSLLNKLLSYGRARFGGIHFEKIRGGENRKEGQFYFSRVEYLVNGGSYQDEYGVDWIILQCIPKSEFYSDFYTSIGIMIGVTVALLIIGIIISSIAAAIFMSPLKNLANVADNIKLLRLEEVEDKLSKNISYFSEIRSLQQSFGSMSMRLNQFKQFIPSHILAVIETEVAHKEMLIAENMSVVSKPSSKGGDVELKTVSDGVTDTTKHSALAGNFNSKGLISKALKSGLLSGSITVMTIQFSDLFEVLETYTTSEVSEATTELRTLVKNQVVESNAQLVSHTHSQAVIAWNTLISQPDHRLRAVKAATNIQNSISQLHDNWRRRGLPLLDIQLGLGSGPAFYGNIGTANTKIFTVVGLAARQSQFLCSMNSVWGTRVLCADSIYQTLKEEYTFRPVDKCPNRTFHFYELGSERDVDSWTCELEQPIPKENDIWFEYTKAFKLYDRREFDEAADILSRYLDAYPYDIVAQKLAERCNQEKSSSECCATKSNNHANPISC